MEALKDNLDIITLKRHTQDYLAEVEISYRNFVVRKRKYVSKFRVPSLSYEIFHLSF